MEESPFPWEKVGIDKMGAEPPELDPVLMSLAASFEAAVARSEEEAAADLALSLRQGRALIELLHQADGLEAHLAGGARYPVTLVGDDFCGFGEPVTRVVAWDSALFQSTASTVVARRSWRLRRTVSTSLK